MSYKIIKDFNSIDNDHHTNTQVILNKSLEDRNSILSENAICIVYNYAQWCGPCKKISPLYDEMSIKYSHPGKCIFIKEDVDNEIDEHTLQYIKGVPCFHFYINSILDHSLTVTGTDMNKLEHILIELLNNTTVVENN
tara:strand:- start:118 stop:531 length:414 start_codon:yes stop_codon:yes gene_type:complete